jgi:hypothetical protein
MKAPFRVSVLAAVFLCTWSYFGPSARGADSSGPSQETSAQSADLVTLSIPGPLRSFLRMAGMSQKISPEEVAPLLARNVFQRGYDGAQTNRHPTEFLLLLIRYVQQARELSALAGPDGVLRVSNCEEAKPLLRVLGYRTRADCGQHDVFLQTDDPQRAFLTVDSGFPLPRLEQSLRDAQTFTYPFAGTSVPVLLADSDWSRKGNVKDWDLLDALLHDPALARFYCAFARMDSETQVALRQTQALKKIIPFAAVLDFYGTQIRIRSGRVLVPGGPAAEEGWKDLVGAAPDVPGEFVARLLAKDNGWLAAYFDSLSRVNQLQQTHFTEARQLRRYYEALRGKDTTPNAATGVFRPDSGLLLLVTRIRWEPNGDPHVPGNLDVWRKTLRQKYVSNMFRDSAKRSDHLDTPGQLLETMFGISRVRTDAGPLQAYLLLSEMDARRPQGQRLSPETVTLLAAKFADLSDQYLIFSEFPELSDASIMGFLSTAASLGKISNNSLRGNALGTFQATVGLWQVLARQGEIPSAELNDSWRRVIKPFGAVGSTTQLFDAGRDSLRELLLVVTGKPEASQDEVIGLLAGPPQTTPEGQRMHQLLAGKIRSVLEEQRLVSLDTLLALGDALHDVAQVKAEANTLLPLARELREFEMPQPIFHASEREEWAAGIYNNRHTELQMRTDLAKIIQSPTSSAQLAQARGQLAPFLRDTLVGLNYAYYEPPGAQILHHNPLFVRSHDFAGDTVMGMEHVWQAPLLFGAGSPAGGGAHLVGSLADLPYVLASAEQDFIAPENVQALIWREVVPGLLTNAIVPRWWDVSRNELHAVTLYQRAGEELLAASVQDEELRNNVMSILHDRMSPQTSEHLELALRAANLAGVLPQLMPADTFYLAAEYRQRFPQQSDSFGTAGKELESLCQHYPADVSWERLSRDFGVPHPILERSYGRDLLNLAPFPAFTGYSSRLLAESWDSNNLYWARLADEQGLAPVMLNRLVPELTRHMVERIFATDMEDWPALLRAARETGDEFRRGKIAALSNAAPASEP